jgi:hypothetical protein
MRRVFKVTLWSIAGLVAVGIGLIGAAYLLSRNMCGNEIVAEIRPPDFRHKAVEFERDCGATTDVSTQVSVMESQKKLGSDDTGNAFTADSNHGSVSVHSSGVMELDMKRLNSNTLEIEYPAGARVFSSNNNVGEVAIQYRAR